MVQPNTPPLDKEAALPPGGLVLSPGNETGVANLPHEAELATMRQMMESLFARVETLQQNQAVQLAGVHDRLDAVELEIPLIQEQSALRIRDLETRMSSEIEVAARAAVEEATAGLQEDVAGKFGSLVAQLETQRKELSQLRDSKKLTESKLNRAVLDIERLVGNLTTRPADAPRPVEVPRSLEEIYRPMHEPASSPFRTRIAEQIRKAAVEAAPDESNPLIGDPQKKPAMEVPVSEIPASLAHSASAGSETPVVDVAQTAARPAARIAQNAQVAPVPAPAAAKPSAADSLVPGFDDWKRQFMQNGEPLNPSLGNDNEKKNKAAICPRCYSERTRPATRTKIDGLLRLTGFTPHRCRSCAHRFYKRGFGDESSLDDHDDSRREEVVETR